MSQRISNRSLSSRGFSMVEVLVILGLIGIVVAIGVPGLINQLFKIRLESAANDVANLIQQTRQRAIRDNVSYTVEVDGDKVVGQTLIGSTAAEPSELEFYNPPIAVYPGGGIADCQDKYDGSGESWGGTSITFDPKGIADDTGAICVWDGGENILQVVVGFSTGHTKIRKFLKTGDAPATEGFFEKASAATSGSAWTWY